MTDQDVDRIRQKFDSFDTDSNGLIDLDEFLDMIDLLYPRANGSYLESVFMLTDQNQDGYIDFQEFLDWWQGEDWESAEAEGK